jgi:hypothetical protein
VTRRRLLIIFLIPPPNANAGKSCFLFYCLLRRLCEKKTTALHVKEKDFVIFADSEAGGIQIYDTAVARSHNIPKRSWALSDSNVETRHPCSAFLEASNERKVLTVQATSPVKERWYEWRKQLHGDVYYMNVFTEDEMVALGLVRSSPKPIGPL